MNVEKVTFEQKGHSCIFFIQVIDAADVLYLFLYVTQSCNIYIYIYIYIYVSLNFRDHSIELKTKSNVIIFFFDIDFFLQIEEVYILEFCFLCDHMLRESIEW